MVNAFYPAEDQQNAVFVLKHNFKSILLNVIVSDNFNGFKMKQTNISLAPYAHAEFQILTMA